MQLGAMQDWQLLVTHLIDHAAREHGEREIVTHWADGSETRTTWAGVRRDALKMAEALCAALKTCRNYNKSGKSKILVGVKLSHFL